MMALLITDDKLFALFKQAKYFNKQSILTQTEVVVFHLGLLLGQLTKKALKAVANDQGWEKSDQVTVGESSYLKLSAY